MQYRPDAATLLDAVADVLEDVLEDVPAAKQHRVRVAAHLTRLVERESRLGPRAVADECRAIAELLGEPVDQLDAGVERLASRLRDPHMQDATLDEAAWKVLVDVTRRDLEVAKPGHADWTGT